MQSCRVWWFRFIFSCDWSQSCILLIPSWFQHWFDSSFRDYTHTLSLSFLCCRWTKTQSWGYEWYIYSIWICWTPSRGGGGSLGCRLSRFVMTWSTNCWVWACHLECLRDGYRRTLSWLRDTPLHSNSLCT